MKVSDRDRNVNKKLVLVVFLVKVIIKLVVQAYTMTRDHSLTRKLSRVAEFARLQMNFHDFTEFCGNSVRA